MKYIYVLALFCINLIHAQETAVTNWINKNAIVIEDANQDTPLTNFKAKRSDIFKGVKLFGFGEATHFTKEFFDLKVKFFKYLAENEGVTLFMMEDVYNNFYEINNFIKGGEGDVREITGNFGFALWRNEEVMGLVQWMRNFNRGKPADKQVKFYSIDCQTGTNTNVNLKRFITNYKIITQEGISTVLDSCSAISIFSKSKDEAKLNGYLQQLQTLQNDIEEDFKPENQDQANDLKDALYTLNILNQFTGFVLQTTQQYRDKCMADNVQWILQHNGPAAKGFIWAHNSHVSKEDTKYKRLGMHLKNTFGNAYYSVGFSYAQGKLYGVDVNDKKEVVGVVYNVINPEKKTPEAVLNQAGAPVFFIDFKQAAQNTAMNSFLNAKLKCMDTGADGFNPKWWGVKAKLADMYDGLIFVREVSLPHYIQGRVRETMQNPVEEISVTR